MTHLDLFTLIVDSIFYRCTNPIFVNIVFAFGLIWTIIRMRETNAKRCTHQDLRHHQPKKFFAHFSMHYYFLLTRREKTWCARSSHPTL